jgi:hypothetical protein
MARSRKAVLYRDDEHRLELELSGRPWSFDADGALLRLVTEANRIKLAHYFDPYLAMALSLAQYRHFLGNFCPTA